MAPRLTTSREKSRTTASVVCVSRAHAAAQWSLARTPSSVLARHWGVSSSRARHLRTDEPENPVSVTLAMVEDPEVDGPAIVASVLEALERRYLVQALDDPKAVRARLAFLVSQEHTSEAHQNRALQSGQGVEAACLTHASELLEIVAIRRALGMVP